MKKSVKKSGSPDNNGAVENLEKAFKHGMCLRSRSGSVSPNKKPGFKKKASAPPVIIRPESSARSSGGMILRPRKKSPPKSERAALKSLPQRPPPSVTVAEKKPRPAIKKSPPSSTEKNLPVVVPKKEKEKEYLPVVVPKKEKENLPLVDPGLIHPTPPPIRGKLTKKQREEEMGRYVQYRAARRISDAGFTSREYGLCQSYLVKRDYEFMDPVPEEYKYCEAFIDQIRRTRGYGLTMSPPRGLGPVGRSFVAYLSQWKKERVVKVYVEKMIQMVLAELEMKIPDKKYHRDGKQIENLVKSDWTHLLSFRVHQGAPADPPEIVEAFFFAPPLGPIVKNLRLEEWKIRQGSEVIFCTDDI